MNGFYHFVFNTILHLYKPKKYTMKKIYIFSPVALAAGAFLWMSVAAGVANIQQKDRTGSPVSDMECNSCHASGISFSTKPTVTVLGTSGVVTMYEPLKKYTVKVEILSSGNVAHGFQLTGLLTDNSAAGLVESVNGNTQKIDLNGRWYFEHSSPLTGGSYTMVWIAPPAGSGDVTFYGSALATNGNSITTGDEFKSIPELTLTEDVSSGIAELNQGLVKLYPNPVVNNLSVELGTEIITSVEIYTVTGTQVMNMDVNSSNLNLDVSVLEKGNYVILINTEKSKYNSKFIKN